MSEPFVGEIRAFAFAYAPKSWAVCNGVKLPIRQQSALYSVIGTQFGGDGVSTFGLPNLQGLLPVDWGQGVGLSKYQMGQTGGATTVKLQIAQMPRHTHTMNAAAPNRPANTGTPTANTVLATATGATPFIPSANNPPLTPMSGQSLTGSGGNSDHNNMMPYLPLNFCIALQGFFPYRPSSGAPE